MAVAEASFRVLILSISLGFRKLSGFLLLPPPNAISPGAGVPPPDRGIPSTTNKGLLLERIELEPLILKAIPAPGSPVVWVI